MALEEIPVGLLGQVNLIIRFLQAAGILIALYISYSIFMAVINYRRFRKLIVLEEQVNRIEGKIDLLVRKKK